MTLRHQDKEALRQWEFHRSELKRFRNINYFETEVQKRERVDGLLSDFFKFAKYYFPNVCKSEFAAWHKKYVKYVVENDVCYAAVQVSRDMAKSSVTAMLIVFLYFKKEFKSLGYFSHIQDQAEMLLKPIKLTFEKNEAIIRDFGNQMGLPWTSNRFTTSTGVSFRAVGAGQNPRGEKNEDADRFDMQVFDDFDDPEVCRNPERLDNNWKYVLGDAFPAMHVSGKRRIIFLNNKIATDCIIHRAFLHGENISNSYRVKVNLVDTQGRSNWPEAYTNQQCKDMLDLVADEAETEYMNNPTDRGKTFRKEWFQFQKLMPLRQYKYLVVYLDGGFKKTKTSDTKALILIGFHEGKFHIRKCYVDNVSIETMIAWCYDLEDYLKVNNATAIWYMEEVFLLSMLHDHFDAAVSKYGHRIPMLGDKRAKPDKDLRINNTAGFFEREHVVFDTSIENDRSTKRLISQYLSFQVGLRNIEKDGPDAVEGGMHILKLLATSGAGNIKVGERYKNKHKL